MDMCKFLHSSPSPHCPHLVCYDCTDTLEDCLPMHGLSGQVTGHTSSDADPDAVGRKEEEGEKEGIAFDIPILPAGKELMVNILSTWGDRHYVGLNGVEVFTVTGELAEVAEVCARWWHESVVPA